MSQEFLNFEEFAATMPTASSKKSAAKTGRAASQSKQIKKTAPAWTAAKISAILDRLEKAYPTAHLELNFTSPLELLIATIMAA